MALPLLEIRKLSKTIENLNILRSTKGLPLSSSILALLALSACGGSSGNGDGVGNGADSDGDGPLGGGETPEPISYTGAVVKGPLENATVFLDYDNDGVLGLDEPSIRTASDGSFSLVWECSRR